MHVRRWQVIFLEPAPLTFIGEDASLGQLGHGLRVRRRRCVYVIIFPSMMHKYGCMMFRDTPGVIIQLTLHPNVSCQVST